MNAAALMSRLHTSRLHRGPGDLSTAACLPVLRPVTCGLWHGSLLCDLRPMTCDQ